MVNLLITDNFIDKVIDKKTKNSVLCTYREKGSY